MPKGIYARKPRVQVDETELRLNGIAHTGTPMNDNEKVELRFDRAAAVERFVAETGRWHTASLGMVAAAAVVFFVGRVEGKPSPAIREELEKSVKERGLKTAQAYRYLGLAQALYTEVTKSHPQETTGQEVLAAETPALAADAILAWCGRHKANSLDRLGLLLGVYARAKAKSGRKTRITPSAEPTAEALAPSLKDAPTSMVVRALQLAEMDPVEFVDALGEAASADALKEMISALQNRLDAIEKPEKHTRWKGSSTGDQNHPTHQ